MRYNTKTCTKCKTEKTVDNFYFFKKANTYYSWCKSCQKARAVESRKQFNTSIEFHDLLKQRFNRMLSSAYQHVKDKPMENLVTIDFLKKQYEKQNGKCYYTGVEMVVRKIGDQAYNPFDMSIDRIDSSKGYIPSNIVLCCYGINVLKSVNTPTVMYESLKAFYEGAKSKSLLP